MILMRRLITITLITCLGWAITHAQQELLSYERHIAPLFAEKCAACHNHTTRQGGLNLESYVALRSGGNRGDAIAPGKSAESLLVKYLEGTLKPQMPFGDKLAAADITRIKRWIDDGAPQAVAVAMPVNKEPVTAEKIAAAMRAEPPAIKPTKPVSAAINSLAFNADGTRLAVARYQSIELHDPRTPQPLATLGVHANEVRSVAFNPDGTRLAAAGGNPGQFGEIKLWDVASGKEIKTWRGHRDNIYAIAFSPDGKLLATCSYDKLIKLWDAATGAEIKTLKDHTDAVFTIAFSPDGKWLASGAADRTVKIWDVATGTRLYTMSESLDTVHSVTFHPSGKLLAGAGADRTLRVWSLGATEGKQLRSLIGHEDAINLIHFAPDGKTLVTTGADKALKFWDAETLIETHEAERQSDWVFGMAYSPDGKRLAVGRYDGTLAIYDALTGSALRNGQ
jgi:WD40 repeat protein